MPDQESLLATVTGEYFQPVRLHYKILNRKGLLSAFESLRCLDYDPPKKRWVWLYAHEAKTLRFKKSYAELPKEVHPIVIGSFFLRSKETLLLDLRSCDRAILAIPFFAKRLPRKVVELGDFEVVNRLFPASKTNMTLTPDVLFDSGNRESLDPVELMRRLAEKTADVEDPQEKLKIMSEYLESRAKKSLPEIERLPTNYAEDGIDGFKLALRLRQLVALKHWQGHADYGMDDVIQTLLHKL